MKFRFSSLGYKGRAGFLLLIGSLIFFYGMVLAEFTYVDYSVSNNFISDLGNFDHLVPALIFNPSIILFGLCAIYAGVVLKNNLDRVLGILIIIAGIGGMGVGIFNEATILLLHLSFAFTVFLVGGFAIIWSIKVLYVPPLSYVLMVLAGIVFFFVSFVISNMLFGTKIHFGIGVGGMERMVVFPTIIWVMIMGIYLLAQANARNSSGKKAESYQ